MWYVPVILLPILLYFLVYLTLYFAGLPLPGRWIVPFGFISGLFALFFLGSVVEETGYMGYAIDPMQERLGALGASVLIGMLWAVWHYPSIIQQGYGRTRIAWGTRFSFYALSASAKLFSLSGILSRDITKSA